VRLRVAAHRVKQRSHEQTEHVIKLLIETRHSDADEKMRRRGWGGRDRVRCSTGGGGGGVANDRERDDDEKSE